MQETVNDYQLVDAEDEEEDFSMVYPRSQEAFEAQVCKHAAIIARMKETAKRAYKAKPQRRQHMITEVAAAPLYILPCSLWIRHAGFCVCPGGPLVGRPYAPARHS